MQARKKDGTKNKNEIKNLISEADGFFYNQQYYNAYDCYERALKLIPEEETTSKEQLECQLASLHCKIKTCTIDIKTARNTLTFLSKKNGTQFLDYDDYIQLLSTILSTLGQNPENKANYFYDYGKLINELFLPQEIQNDDFSDENIDSNRSIYEITMAMLNLDNNVSSHIHELEKAIRRVKMAKEHYQSHNQKGVLDCNQLLASLHEALADKYFDDEDQSISMDKRIASFKKAFHHYETADTFLDTPSDIEKSLFSALSRLYVLERLADIDKEKSNDHIKTMKELMEATVLKAKTNQLQESKADNIKKQLAEYQELVSKLETNKGPSAKIPSATMFWKKRLLAEYCPPQPMEIEVEVPTEHYTSSSVLFAKNNFDSDNNRLSLNQRNDALKETFNKVVERLISEIKLTPPFCSEILRAMARFHVIHFENAEKNPPRHRNMIISLYKKSLILDEDNQQAEQELSNFMAMYTHTKELAHQTYTLSEDGVKKGFINYFRETFMTYCDEITNTFPYDLKLVMAGLFKHLTEYFTEVTGADYNAEVLAMSLFHDAAWPMADTENSAPNLIRFPSK